MKSRSNQLKSALSRFIADDRGVVEGVNYLLLVTVVAIGMVAGLSSLRDQIVQSYGDSALALRNLDQSYAYQLFDQNGDLIDPDSDGYSAIYEDTVGVVAPVVVVGPNPLPAIGNSAPALVDGPGAPGDISFGVAPAIEGTVIVVPLSANGIAPGPEGTPLP